MAGNESQGEEEPSGVMDRLTALLVLFAIWAKEGVPPGVKYPTSLNAARTWTNVEYGVAVGIGSKRDIATTHPLYGPMAKKLATAMKKLEPAKVVPRRVSKTAKAKAYAAEEQKNHYKARLEGATAQLVQKEYDLEFAQRELSNSRQQLRDLRANLDALNDKLAKVTRDLALRGGGLQVVN